ncbi:MAG TPA: helix-turn-helix domain-containing protein [Vicinamibacterales bacterium]
MAQHTTPPPALAEREASTYIGYRPAALRCWRREGRGPAYVRHGRSVRYLVRDLDAWLDRHRVETREAR